MAAGGGAGCPLKIDSTWLNGEIESPVGTENCGKLHRLERAIRHVISRVERTLLKKWQKYQYLKSEVIYFKNEFIFESKVYLASMALSWGMINWDLFHKWVLYLAKLNKFWAFVWCLVLLLLSSLGQLFSWLLMQWVWVSYNGVVIVIVLFGLAFTVLAGSCSAQWWKMVNGIQYTWTFQLYLYRTNMLYTADLYPFTHTFIYSEGDPADSCQNSVFSGY